MKKKNEINVVCAYYTVFNINSILGLLLYAQARSQYEASRGSCLGKTSLIFYRAH